MEYIAHHGIKGMKWGVRRYQNPDGSLTPEGRRRYLTTIGDRTDLSKTGNKAINKYLDKNPGNYRNPLLDNEWEHDFGTSDFVKEVLTKYGKLIDQGKIFTSEFADTHALLKKAEDGFNSYNDVLGSRYLRNQREYGKQLDSGEAKAKANEYRKEYVQKFERDGAHRSGFAKERGLSTSKEVYDYFKKVAKNFNEYDPDQITYQHMDDAWDMLDRGYITKETFNKLYDAQLSIDAYNFWDNVFSNGSPEDYAWLDYWHDVDKHK